MLFRKYNNTTAAELRTNEWYFRQNVRVGGASESTQTTLYGGSNNAVLKIVSATDGREHSLVLPDASDDNSPLIWTTGNSFQWNVDGALSLKLQSSGDVQVGSNGAERNIVLNSAAAKGLLLYNAGTLVGDITSQDTTWLRINQNAAKNIYTPRMIRADGGFQVDGLAIIEDNGDVRIQDSKYLHFGSSTVMNAWSSGGNMYFQNEGSSYTWWRDGSGTAKILLHPNSNYMRLQDNVRLDLGSNNDSRLYHNGSDTYWDMYTGSLYLRDSTTSKFLFQDNGNFTCTGSITGFGTISDIRTKDKVKRIDNALNKVSQLDGITFVYKKRPDTPLTGVIAQQVMKVLPEAVYEVEEEQRDIDGVEGHLAVRHGNMVGLLIEAIKELEDRVKELEKGI